MASKGPGKVLRIGLTGGIASGKSTVVAILRELGAAVVDADRIVHAVEARGGEAYGPIVAAFGPGVVGPDGELDRAALARRVFSDPEARRRLEAIVHPIVRRRMAEEVEAAARAGARAVVLDIPLLFETGYQAHVDQVWVVYVDPPTQLRRLVARDGLDEAEARRRIDAQMPLEEKRRLADVVIDNRGDPAATRAQVEAAWRAVLAAAGGGEAGR
ncbi:dephospho-CoA kinase [Caldinitratiruptor microaerophilus]|uniref:Dephospho-CoA kinase n=1 Tax=Caldinitratiruptor microaerophilus TaxID=671077 RepID=A0AA35CP47_9FIRM|nr:dephospho-CoA kinase [Caldinitratiruptor microaerophilus]BDG61015.1 dephospho-CoA kinase [Caldinitratiruptor microaerophilus]